MSRSDSNAPEHRRWNDPAWTSVWLHRQQVTEAVADHLVAHLDPRPGERVLDIGCGSGGLSLRAAELVGPSGAVLGADISELLVELARERAAVAGCENATFALADAQVDTLGTEPFDAVASQFGVMFFDEPTVAFANLASHVRPGGRLAFSCWQHMADNPWFTGAVLARFVAPAPEPAPGKSRTGPFSLADPERVSALLESAGWSQVERTPYELTVTVPRRAIVDDHELDGLGLSGADLDEAGDALRRHVARFDQGNGSFTVPLAFQVFTARV
jgi:2-polyprenyl-3-methyl-5-hydroxy-6-metoxy-1,4-benzoquinol methylase